MHYGLCMAYSQLDRKSREVGKVGSKREWKSRKHERNQEGTARARTQTVYAFKVESNNRLIV